MISCCLCFSFYPLIIYLHCFIRFLVCVFVPYLSEAVKGVRKTLGALERLRERADVPSANLSIPHFP